MVGIQLASARIGRVTGKGLTENFATLCPRWLVATLVLLLLVGQRHQPRRRPQRDGRLRLRWCWPAGPGTPWASASSWLLLQVLLPYERYVKLLKWLTLTLLAYVGVGFAVEADWVLALESLGDLHAGLPLEPRLRDHRGRDPRHHDQSLPLLLAGHPGSRGDPSRGRRPSAARRAGQARTPTAAGCAWTPRSAWGSPT